MRWLIVSLVVFVGCVASLPGDAGLTADLACEAAREVQRLRQTLSPSPAPAPATVCENCNGTGKIGDGRIVMTCPACGGTGKPTRSVLKSPECKDGTCRP